MLKLVFFVFVVSSGVNAGQAVLDVVRLTLDAGRLLLDFARLVLDIWTERHRRPRPLGRIQPTPQESAAVVVPEQRSDEEAA